MKLYEKNGNILYILNVIKNSDELFSNFIDIKNELFKAGKNTISKVKEKNISNYDIMKDDNLTWFLRQAMIKKLVDFDIIKKSIRIK